jgi:two-component system, NtrC family, C4-dicarboxylate transport sensor histidine kinase DctB
VAPTWSELVIAANRHAVCAKVARWLIHDIRNPTQALTLLTSMMDDGPMVGGAPIAETLQLETAHVARSLDLLDRLVTQAAAETVPGPISLLSSLQFVTALYGAHHPLVELEAVGPGAASLPAVQGVAHDIELIVLNLVLNSLEALRGRPKGRIALVASHAGAEVRVTVSDDGPGMTHELEAHLFEPGVSGWSRGGFAGLGLAASRALAERYGGSLTYKRESRPGVSFVLALPTIN